MPRIPQVSVLLYTTHILSTETTVFVKFSRNCNTFILFFFFVFSKKHENPNQCGVVDLVKEFTKIFVFDSLAGFFTNLASMIQSIYSMKKKEEKYYFHLISNL